MYIVFEGIVWSGKSTQSKKLISYLQEQYGIDQVVYVREPWSTPIAEDIRYIAQAKEWNDDNMHPLTDAYLYAAARAQTLHTIVKPALDAGKIVVSDRCFLSSLAFQWEAQWLWFDTVLSINQQAIANCMPDKVYYMDIDIEVALDRTFDEAGDKWEKNWKDFFEKIIHGYEKCEKLEIMKNRFFRIDASGNEHEVFEKIKRTIVPKKLIDWLKRYDFIFQEEWGIGAKFLDHIQSFWVSVFSNEHWHDGHITGAILITNPNHTKILLMKHKKLWKWLQFWGHSDGSANILETALREFREESGISKVPIVYKYDAWEILSIFDLDIHEVPPDTKRNWPRHKHYDIRFLGIINDNTFFTKQEEEVDDIAWFTLSEAYEQVQDPSLLRMLDKLKNIS